MNIVTHNSISRSVIAVILGGGAGSRLFPLTESRSKPAVPIGGKYRLVDIPISNCINSKINRIFVLTQFNSASLNKHIKNTYHFDAFTRGFVDILAAEQTPDNPGWYQGTADAVRQSVHHFENSEYDYVLILSGDQLYQMNFEEMLEHHIQSESEITIATIPVHEQDASSFGILKMNDQKFITSFIEKPTTDKLADWVSDTGETMMNQGKKYLASMGIYMFNRKALTQLLVEGDVSHTDFGKEIIPSSLSSHKVSSFQYEGYWEDIGNIRSFFEANLAFSDEVPPFNLFDFNSPIYTRSRMLPPAKISGTTMHLSTVAEGCIINALRLEHSVIGIRSRIGFNTSITHSYIMGNDYYETIQELQTNTYNNKPNIGIGDRCFLRNTIVDKNCSIGHDVYIEGSKYLPDQDTPLYSIKSGIVVIKKKAVIPNGFTIR